MKQRKRSVPGEDLLFIPSARSRHEQRTILPCYLRRRRNVPLMSVPCYYCRPCVSVGWQVAKAVGAKIRLSLPLCARCRAVFLENPVSPRLTAVPCTYFPLATTKQHAKKKRFGRHSSVQQQAVHLFLLVVLCKCMPNEARARVCLCVISPPAVSVGTLLSAVPAVYDF